MRKLALIALLLLVGCAVTPTELKRQPPVLIQNMKGNWKDIANCILVGMDDKWGGNNQIRLFYNEQSADVYQPIETGTQTGALFLFNVEQHGAKVTVKYWPLHNVTVFRNWNGEAQQIIDACGK